MRTFLAALVFLAPMLGNVDAGGCYRQSYYYPQQVVQKEIVNVYPVLQYFQVPLYSAVYQPAQYSSTFTSSYSTVSQAAQLYATPAAYVAPVAALVQPKTCEEKFSELKLEVEQMKLQLRNGGTMQQTTGGGWQAVLQNKCAACHSAEKLAAGTDFVMFRSGQIEPFDSTAKGKILAELGLGTMPKKNGLGITALTDTEYKEVVTWIKGTLPMNLKAPLVNGQPQPAPLPNGEKK